MATPAETFRPHVGVHLILIHDGQVLLLLRANTGFADGFWSVPGGCLDAGETLPAGAAREAREELGIIIDPADLALAHVCHHADPDGQARIGVFFTTTRWTGEPVNAEPGKCDKIDWFPLDGLPGDVVTYIRTGIDAYRRGHAFSLDGWPADPHEDASAGAHSYVLGRALKEVHGQRLENSSHPAICLVGQGWQQDVTGRRVRVGQGR